MLKLHISPRQGKSFVVVTENEDLIVGRSSKADLVIDDPVISRKHVRIFTRDGVAHVEDLKSHNGTQVNGLLITKATPLQEGDVIKISGNHITVRDPRESIDFAHSHPADSLFVSATMILDGTTPPQDISDRDSMRRYVDHLSILNELHRVIIGPTKKDEVLQIIMERTFNCLQPEVATLFLLNQDGALTPAATQSKPGTQGDAHSSAMLANQVLEKGMSALVHDVTADARFSQVTSIQRSGIKSLIAAPLLDSEGALGMIALDSHNPDRKFTEEDLRLLTAIASVAAMRLRNITLVEEAAENLKSLNRKLEQMVAERTRELEAKNNHIMSSLRYARKIQTAILPMQKAMQAALPEHFILFEPKEIVSGDFYWFHNRGDQIFLVVADCTGHGVPGAFMSMIGHTLLNKIIIENHVQKPSQILKELHQDVQVALKQEREDVETPDGMEVSLCLIEKSRGRAVFSGAGRPLFHATQNPNTRYSLDTIKGDRQGIGGKQRGNMGNYGETFVPIKTGDMLYLTTDGFIDLECGPERRFGSKRFKSLLESVAGKRPLDQKQAMLQVLNENKDAHGQRDDITVLGIRIT